jgi:hypothetical protein
MNERMVRKKYLIIIYKLNDLIVLMFC